jgi:hypothetical protein
MKASASIILAARHSAELPSALLREISNAFFFPTVWFQGYRFRRFPMRLEVALGTSHESRTMSRHFPRSCRCAGFTKFRWQMKFR